MNIIVKTYGSNRCCCRPDTTWERENRDFYSPESVKGLEWTPVLFARICKAGKCVSKKFASRYYDSINYGMLMYAADFIDGSAEGYACASSIDHTSILPSPMYNRIVLGESGNHFKVKVNGEEVFDYNSGTIDMIEEAIEAASALISLRIGDYIAIELSNRTEIREDREHGTQVSGEFCSNPSFDFRIVR